MIKLLEKFGYFPRVAVWELTLRCNLACRHCGSRAGKPREDELSLGEALALCEDLARLHCQRLTLGGGEPTLRRDWPAIATKLIELGVRVGMITNGLTWNDELSAIAKRVGLESVAFSVDGLDEAHDHVRRHDGHLRKVLAAIDSCRLAGVRVGAITTVNARNKHELEAVRGLLAAHGVRNWQVQLATATGNLADHPELALAPEDMLDLVPRIAAMCADRRRPTVHPGHDIGYYGGCEERLRGADKNFPFWTGCSAGCSVIGIESHGHIKGCLSLPSSQEGVDTFVEGNIRQTPLEEIWRRKGAFAYNREFTREHLGGYCRECEYGEICRGGCTWMGFANERSLRDNPYCYHRQLKAREASRPAAAEHVHLPVAR